MTQLESEGHNGGMTDDVISDAYTDDPKEVFTDELYRHLPFWPTDASLRRQAHTLIEHQSGAAEPLTDAPRMRRHV